MTDGLQPRHNNGMQRTALRTAADAGRWPHETARNQEEIGTDTIIATIRGVRGHDRACYGFPEPLHPAMRIL